jgi:hypothetical protein
MNILVVEDSKANLDEAKKYFGRIKDKEGVEIFYARDYRQAEAILKKEKIDGVISDLFFPEEEGAEGSKLGDKLYEEIAASFDYQPRIPQVLRRKISEVIGERAKWESKTCFDITIYELATLRDEPGRLEDALKELGALRGQGKGTFDNIAPIIAMHHSHPLLRGIKRRKKMKERGRMVLGQRMSENEEHGALLQGYMSKPENQPLGILVGKFAKEKGIPLVFITSLHAGHDSAATPVSDYMKELGLHFPVVEPDGYGLSARKQDISEESSFVKKESDWEQAYKTLRESQK